MLAEISLEGHGTKAGMRRTALALAAIALIATAVRAGDPLSKEARALRDPLAKLTKGTGSKSELLWSLEHARFLVGARELVVGPVTAFLETEIQRESDDVYPAIRLLCSYGPHAERAGPVLEKPRDRIGLYLVARILVARPENLDPLWSQFESSLGRVRAAFDPAKPETAETLRLWIEHAEILGVRGEAIATAAAEWMRNPVLAKAVEAGAIHACQGLRGLAAPFAATIVGRAAQEGDQDDAVTAMAWLSNLDGDQERLLFEKARGHLTAYRGLETTRAVALTVEHALDLSLQFLEARRDSRDPAVSAWATAGLARRRAGTEQQALVGPLLRLLSSKNAEARTAAADGLLQVTPASVAVLAAAERALTDPDLRVRWRAGAMLALAGEKVEAALPSLERGVDSPDDHDRVAAFDAIARIGPRASPLRNRILPWTKVPFPFLRSRAERAVVALGSGATVAK
jgi:hypothetical protein